MVKPERVPPYDLEAETAVLGSMMLNPDAVDAALALRPADFYDVGHGLVFSAIVRLHEDERPVDPITLRDYLEQSGKAAQAAGPDGDLRKRLLEIHASAPASAHAAQYVSIVLRDARARRALVLAGEIAEAVYAGQTGWEAHAERLGDIALDAAAAATFSWDPQDVGAILDGNVPTVKPEYLVRSDLEALLYPGKVHAFNAEPEAGKTWLALVAVAEALDRGDVVLYLDFEDSLAGIIGRLLGLGVPKEYIREQLIYVRPDEALDARARLTVQKVVHERTPTLAVIDGVAEALAISGLDEDRASDVARFLVALPRMISAAGVTVVMIDHVAKAKDNQGRYARGSGHKLAGVDVVFKLESVAPFGRGLVGVSKLVIQKDRHGWIRRLGKHVADFRVDGRNDVLAVTLTVPEKTTDAEGHDRPTACMEAISKLLEKLPRGEKTNVRELRKKRADGGVGFKATTVAAAVDQLCAGGFIATEDGPRGATLVSFRKAYREANDSSAVHSPATPIPAAPDLFEEDVPPWPEEEDF